jgi:phage terminase small subunit
MLTAKEEKFCQSIAIENMTQIDAYKKSYNAENMSDKVCSNKASLLMQKGDIRVKIDELRKEARNDKIINTIQKKELLTQWIYEMDSSKADRLKAMDILNKMDGEYIEKVEAKQDIKISMDSNLDNWGK